MRKLTFLGKKYEYWLPEVEYMQRADGVLDSALCYTLGCQSGGVIMNTALAVAALAAVLGGLAMLWLARFLARRNRTD